ncbi:Response regulator receiver domain-containing protein [Gillisia sp. Hel1_33_143]|uniref:response regulator n=1 Tax=unclassified Gillisia TaxID=2615025 RepID=UPI000558AD4E|nr:MULTISPECIES: response regulator [unclassified Gillisia]SDR78797.1 Response regulator receiver domain-containing protein [Gillisia sp. Hel1_33_143]
MKNKLNILFIEDDEIEVMKLNRTLNKIELKHSIREAKDGEEALQILSDKNRLPDIILLDLNMPKMNGIEFLKILKADETLKYIPTIILTTSNNRKDVLTCYEIGIAGYVIKPLKYEEYVQKLNAVLNYWSENELIKP